MADDSHPSQPRPPDAAGELISEDDRSVAADSWSIKSEYGSTFDDDQRHADASDALASVNFPPTSEYCSDVEDDGITSLLGLQSYWEDCYANELAYFRELGEVGQVWFGIEIMEALASWTTRLCIGIYKQGVSTCNVDGKGDVSQPTQGDDQLLSTWNVLDLGTGNGLLLHELAKNGFSDLTGADFSEGAIVLARELAEQYGFTNIDFVVDDILESKLERKYSLVMDKGTLDAIGLHPEGSVKRIMYWDSAAKLLSPGGLLVITSCNHTKDELIQEVESYNRRRTREGKEPESHFSKGGAHSPTNLFQYLDHVKSYSAIMLGGVVGSRIATVAFLRS